MILNDNLQRESHKPRGAPPQSRDSSGQVSTSTHPPAAATSSSIRHDLAASHSYAGCRCVIRARTSQQEYWHCTALVYTHTTLRTLPACDMSLGSLTVAMPQAGDFVESLEPYAFRADLCLPANRGATNGSF
jgi:hypothetical protein